MPKKKKTREQKMLADKRRTTASESLYTFTSTLPKSQEKQSVLSGRKPTVTVSTASYQYLAGDLRRTLLITLFILVGELVIYYFTRGV